MSKRIINMPLSEHIDASVIDNIAMLKKDLGAIGVCLAIPDELAGGTLVFEYDDEAHKRNAGRKRKAVPTNSKLAEITQEQMDEWLLKTPIADIQEALEIGRATAYRRVKEARARVEYAVFTLPDSDSAYD